MFFVHIFFAKLREFAKKERKWRFLRSLTTEAMGIGGLREHLLSWNDKVNAGAKPAKCTSASQWT